MHYDFNDPNFWFDRAKEIRERIDLMRDPGNREVISRIIHDYERLGSRALKIRKRVTNENQQSIS